jgi:epoxyqueuosine reductase
VKRIGVTRFLRNLLIAAGNSGDPTLLPRIEAQLDAEAPLVRAMAVWAFGRLASRSRLHDLAGLRMERESDPAVAAEWTLALRGEGQRQS